MSKEIVIVGGGPVGLFMGIALLEHGFSCTILEQRKELISDTRSLGIHPVSLELFDQLNLTETFLENGIKVFEGIAHTGKRLLGAVTFEQCPEPYNYILINPQNETERILRDEFLKRSPSSYKTGIEVTHIQQGSDHVDVHYGENGHKKNLSADFVIGCDGKNSRVRQAIGIHYSGKRYPDTYIMGDFEDNTGLNSNAAVYLPAEGLIECFPLPGNKRRWVVKTDDYVNSPTAEQLSALVKGRIGHSIPVSTNSMLSSFGVQHLMAESFQKGRVFLVGDAAHVVSPIGGQGMNLGWLGAWNLALRFKNGTTEGYSTSHQVVVKKAAMRAEMNMKIGRKSRFPLLKETVLKGILHSPLRHILAKLFTMRGLDNWWV